MTTERVSAAIGEVRVRVANGEVQARVAIGEVQAHFEIVEDFNALQLYGNVWSSCRKIGVTKLPGG